MIGFDTTILVRYFAQDDPVQSDIANKLVEKYSIHSEKIFINNIVICEIVWVLESAYKYKKPEILLVMKEILATLEFAFENYQLLWLAILEYENVDVDLSDILIGKINQFYGCKYTVSFDKKAAILEEFSNASLMQKI